jgi:hypothetical protein
VLWRPPRADGGDDIAGLELDGDPPPGAHTAPLAQVEDLWGHSFRVFGFPRGQDTGVWATGRLLGRQATNWVQIEGVKETGFAVEPGFSGTPVWDTQDSGRCPGCKLATPRFAHPFVRLSLLCTR